MGSTMKRKKKHNNPHLTFPPSELKRFLEEETPTLTAIERFANEIGIAPGIVVGRLQHDGIIPQSMGNGLKVFYRWAGDNKE